MQNFQFLKIKKFFLPNFSAYVFMSTFLMCFVESLVLEESQVLINYFILLLVMRIRTETGIINNPGDKRREVKRPEVSRM